MYEIAAVSNHYWFSGRYKIGIMKKPSTREVFIANTKMLMELAGDSQHALAKKSGLRQSTLSNMLSGRHNIAVENAEAVAKVYGLEGWHLLLRNLPKDLRETKSISKLVKGYLASSAEGRELIGRIAEREAVYEGSQEDGSEPDDNDAPSGTNGRRK
jgi:transcriptional regulator with XRE-family HTH domain